MPDRKSPPLLLGVPEISKYIGRTERQTAWLVESGKLPTFRLGARVAMSPAAFDEMIQRRSAAALARVEGQ